MLVHRWQRIGVGARMGRRQLHDSRAVAGQCCRVAGVGALVGRCHCHGVGAGAQVSKGKDLTINLRGGRRGEGRGQRTAWQAAR
jgi:hypothetical protein